MATPFRVSRRVEFCETDMAGIVHFANFFRYMEWAEVEYLRPRGLNVQLHWEGQMIGFPRVSATCDFIKPVMFDDILDIEVAIDRLGTKSVTFAFDFSCKGAHIAQGKVTSVCCRNGQENHLEAIPIPTSYRQRLLSDL